MKDIHFLSFVHHMPVNYVVQEKHHSSMVVETPLQQTCKKNTQEQAMISAGLTKRSSKAAETLILRVHMRTINCRPLERNTLFLTFLIGINIYAFLICAAARPRGVSMNVRYSCGLLFDGT